jgi:hypothetical protein
MESFVLKNTRLKKICTVLKRIEKYKSRGFEITLDFNPEEELFKAKYRETKSLTCKDHQSCYDYRNIYT